MDQVSGEFSSDWKVSRLGELLSEVDVRFASQDDSNLEVLSLTKDHGLILQSERFGKRIATEDVSKYKVVKKGQIVYNPYVIWEGAVHALRKHDRGLVSPVYCVWELIESDGGFLDYLLRTPPLIEAYNAVCSGAVNRRRSISKPSFKDIEIALPPLEERRAISSALDTAQFVIQATENVLVAAKQLKASLMKHLFTYGPVPVDQADKVALKETKIGPMPEHWDLVPLGDIIADGPQNGLYKPMSEYGSGTPIVRIDDYPNEGGIVSNPRHKVNLSSDEISRYGLHEDDLLINRVNSLSHLGKCALIGDLREPIVFESNMMRLLVNRQIALPFYTFMYLCSPAARTVLRGTAKRAVAQSSINQGDVQALPVPLPKSGEQTKIINALATIDNKIIAETQRKQALAQLFSSMLHHLMTGKVRVPGFGDAQEAALPS